MSSLPGDGGTHPTHGSANFFHIEEIEAFLTTATPAEGIDPINDQALLSLGATATDLSAAGAILNFGGNPDNVINGLLQGGGTTWTTGDVENFEAKIRIDLGASRDIGTVRVWNRTPNCCGDRLEDFTVRFFSDDGAGGVGAQIGEDIVHSGQVPNGSFSVFTPVPGTQVPFAITAIEYAPETEQVTLTWTSRPGETYNIKYSTDMTDWDAEIVDNITFENDEVGDDGDKITVTFNLLDVGAAVAALDDLFFRVEVAGSP